MSGTGYIINGKYVRTKNVPGSAKVPRRQPGAKEFEAQLDRERFAKDLVQPYLPNGKPNPEFITALPEEAERYGFVNKDDSNARRRKK